MITLFIDTSSEKAKIAIVNDSSILYEFEKAYEQDMSKYLVNEIKTAFEAVKLDYKDISNIVIAVGPGSFTGVRMGITVAKTMAYALDIKVYPISSLLLMAMNEDDLNKMPVIDARRGYVYGALYDNNLNVLIPESYILLEELRTKSNVFGNYTEISTADFEYNVLKAISMATSKPIINTHELKPNYLKITQAERELLERNGS